MLASFERCARNGRMAFRCGEVQDNLHVFISQHGLKALISTHIIMCGKHLDPFRRSIEGTEQLELRVIAQRGHVVIGDKARANDSDIHGNSG